LGMKIYLKIFLHAEVPSIMINLANLILGAKLVGYDKKITLRYSAVISKT